MTAQVANDLVAMDKHILRLPTVGVRSGTLRMTARRIYSTVDGTILPLSLYATVPESSRTQYAAAAVLCVKGLSQPIRGFNYHVKREFADGTVVFGWHEHLYDPAYAKPRNVGRPFPDPLFLDLKSIFLRACEHWNIRLRPHNPEAGAAQLMLAIN